MQVKLEGDVSGIYSRQNIENRTVCKGCMLALGFSFSCVLCCLV